MNLHKKNLKVVFFISLILTIFVPIHIHFFIPFLVIQLYKKPFIHCLWGALGCGIILDLLSPHERLGIYAVNYTLATALLYTRRRQFFADSVITLPAMTFFFSVISSILQLMLINLFDKAVVITLANVWKDLILMPAADALFAFTLYIIPSLLFGKPIRQGKDYFMQEGD